MRTLLILICLISFQFTNAQRSTDALKKAVKQYHQAMVSKDLNLMDAYTSTGLLYRHSNGWVETKEEQLSNIRTGYIIYHSFQEDSLRFKFLQKNAKVNFNATIDVTLKGDRHTYLLKVEEEWKRKGRHWYIFTRQATR
jgi:hypothetical protein